jgi:hypothetical protein
MPAATKTGTSRTHPEKSSIVSIVSGWARHGAESFLATQRMLLDLAMRQNANVMQSVRQQLTDPHHSPTALLSEVAGEGMTNFIEGQKVLLDLGKQQNEILMAGVKEQVGDWPAVQAMTDLLQRNVETFVHMQQEFLKIARKQSHTWMEATKSGKAFHGEPLLELAREGMDNFVKAQKHFLDVIVEETAKATGSKKAKPGLKKIKKAELSEMARQATESLIDAQKKLVDIAGKQMNANMKTAGKSLELLRPFPFLPLSELTREGVNAYVNAQKALMEVVGRSAGEHKAPGKPAHHAKKAAHAQKEKAKAAAA